MQIQNFDALSGMLISMTSPAFTRTEHHCLSFEYDVRAQKGIPGLEVHVRRTDYMLSGEQIWSSEYQASQHNHANITIWATELAKDFPYVLDFVGILAEPRMTSIRVDNIVFSSGQCKFESDFSAGNMSGNDNMV